MRRLTVLYTLLLALCYGALLLLAGSLGPVLTAADRLVGLVAALGLLCSAVRLFALFVSEGDLK